MEDRTEYLRRHSLYQKAYALRLRDKCLVVYGGEFPCCACCGETEKKFLAIDHINGGGTAHRRQIKCFGSSMYEWLKRNGFPKGFQLLCHNCNSAKAYYGKCPHIIE